MTRFSDGLIAVVKRGCPTCTLIEPVIRQLAVEGKPLTVFTQDDPVFPAGAGTVIDDTDLENSYHLEIDVVPTLVRIRDGKEVARTYGWDRTEWETLTGIRGLGAGLPESRPGCGSKTREHGMGSRLVVRFGDVKFKARNIELPRLADDIEACYERGWTDGLPVVPPTRERVLEMLGGTRRD